MLRQEKVAGQVGALAIAADSCMLHTRPRPESSAGVARADEREPSCPRVHVQQQLAASLAPSALSENRQMSAREGSDLPKTPAVHVESGNSEEVPSVDCMTPINVTAADELAMDKAMRRVATRNLDSH